MLRPIRDQILATHMHRSGWPYVMNALEPLFDDKALVVFDDFLEKTFFKKRTEIHSHPGPWVGVAHHPPDTPSWYDTEHPQLLAQVDEWRESLENFRLCVALSENVASWVRSEWGVPCITLRHPTELPRLSWSPERFACNQSKMLVQVGWYLRNTHAIYQVHAPSFVRKAWLRQDSPQIARNHQRCSGLFPRRSTTGEVEEIPAVPDSEYDRLLSENVVFVEIITAAANNTVVECIARNTPIIINNIQRRNSTLVAIIRCSTMTSTRSTN